MMRAFRLSSLVPLILAASAPLALAGDKLDGNDKKWLAQVSALIQSDEQTIYKSIPKADRSEFQVIFWARRNPQGPSAPSNEFKDRVLQLAAEADKKLGIPGTTGAATGCGRVYILLGPPDKVAPAGASPEFGGMDALGGVGRAPEIWTYKDRPGVTFPGGQATIPFDGNCNFPGGATLNQQLTQHAAAMIVTPDVKPEVGPDGRLVPLVDLLKRRRTPAQMLFVSPRQDFTLEIQQKLAMRVPLGNKVGTYIAGLLRIPVLGLTVKEEAGKKKVAVLVASQMVDGNKKVVREMDGERTAEVGADGRIVISYSAVGPAGSYTLRIAVADVVSGKASVLETPITLPDLTSPGLKVMEPMVLAGMEPTEQSDAQNPLADFSMGSVRLLPRFGNAFRKSDGVQFLCMGYGAARDSASGKATVTARFEVFRGDKLMTAGVDLPIDTEDFVPVVGPIPLASVEPGIYQVKAIVVDKIAKKDLTSVATYEILP
jgi:GWxTD domain-containing protein